MQNNQNKKLQNFKFKHALGQNFLSDADLLTAISDDALINKNDNILEIGPGSGALTEILCKKATNGKVLSIEIDKDLEQFLTKLEEKYSNLKVVFNDILKVNLDVIKAYFCNQSFKVVANLPYYITTPIIFFLIESDLNIQSITIMVQEEVANRIVAKPSTKDYAAITPILQMYGSAKITRLVNRNMFFPVPNVDSAVLHINIQKDTSIDRLAISKFIKSCFVMRRKTLINNLIKALDLDRNNIESICNQLEIPLQIRAESLTLSQFKELYSKLFNFIKIDKNKK